MVWSSLKNHEGSVSDDKKVLNNNDTWSSQQFYPWKWTVGIANFAPNLPMASPHPGGIFTKKKTFFFLSSLIRKKIS
jgi:hypothetical protein